MRPLRIAAFVMLLIAFIDGVMELVEYFADASLWQVLLSVGILVLIVDLLFDPQSFLGRYFQKYTEWLLEKLKNMLRFTKATTVGSGVMEKEQPKQQKEAPASSSGSKAEAQAGGSESDSSQQQADQKHWAERNDPPEKMRLADDESV